MRYLSTFLVLALAACTIDASTESEDATEYEVTYTAPEAASWVSMCDNFSGHWGCGDQVVGRVSTWSGELDAVRLCKTPEEGGYVVNWMFSADPHWALSQDGLGGFVAVGDPIEPLLAGPQTFAAVRVDNEVDGGNYWLAGSDCD